MVRDALMLAQDSHAEWIASILRSDPQAVGLCPASAKSFTEATTTHGATCLVVRALREDGTFGLLPIELRKHLLDIVRREQGLELVRRTELRRTFEAFEEAEIPALVFKGAALAYTHYPSPHLRPRVDTDLLVKDTERVRAVRVLENLGYQQQNAVDRDALFTQATFCRDSVGHVRHMVDLHWRIANRPLFRELLAFDELAAEAVPIQALGPWARTPGGVHSLLLACIHPVAHHHCEWPFIWLYDVLLLAERLDSMGWRRFRSLATVKRVSVICKRTFEMAEQYSGPASWLRESGILDVDEAGACEPSTKYLSQTMCARRDLLLDLSASNGLWAKGRLLVAHAFPDVRYMREAYGASSRLELIGAYRKRILRAVADIVHGRESRVPGVNANVEG